MQKKDKPLKPIEPPLPIYVVNITNGHEKIFYAMMTKEDAYDIVKKKKPEELLKKIDKQLDGTLNAVVEEKLP